MIGAVMDWFMENYGEWNFGDLKDEFHRQEDEDARALIYRAMCQQVDKYPDEYEIGAEIEAEAAELPDAFRAECVRNTARKFAAYSNDDLMDACRRMRGNYDWGNSIENALRNELYSELRRRTNRIPEDIEDLHYDDEMEERQREEERERPYKSFARAQEIRQICNEMTPGSAPRMR